MFGFALRKRTPRDSFGNIPRISNGATAPKVMRAAAPLRFEDVNAVPNGFAGGIHNRERDDSARIKHEIARDIFASRYRVEHVQGVRGPEPARLQL